MHLAVVGLQAKVFQFLLILMMTDTLLGQMLKEFSLLFNLKLTNLCEKIDDISSRMESIEGRQKSLEEEIRVSSSCSSPIIVTPLSGGRRRRTPVALQVSLKFQKNSALIFFYCYIGSH